MLAHASEIRQTLSLIDHARAQLDNLGIAYGQVRIGAMIEIPAAALSLRTFLKYFDFLSIGTNDLIQCQRRGPAGRHGSCERTMAPTAAWLNPIL
jgi:phosphotransferase system enzyme I (PtsI)